MIQTLDSHISVMKRTESSEIHIDDAPMVHSILGMVSEYFELKDVFNRCGQGTRIDLVNLKEELGDMIWYLCLAVDTLELSFADIIDINNAYNKPLGGPNDIFKHFEDALVYLADAVKANLFYHRGYEVDELTYNLRIVMKQVLLFINAFDFTVEDVCAANFQKLKARYPEEYSDFDANNRDLAKERDALEADQMAELFDAIQKEFEEEYVKDLSTLSTADMMIKQEIITNLIVKAGDGEEFVGLVTSMEDYVKLLNEETLKAGAPVTELEDADSDEANEPKTETAKESN